MNSTKKSTADNIAATTDPAVPSSASAASVSVSSTVSVASAASVTSADPADAPSVQADLVPSAVPAVKQAISALKKPITTFKKTKRKRPHWQLPGSCYWITFSALKTIEFTDIEKDVIFDACKYFDKKKYLLYAAIVMPNHVHMLLQPNEVPNAKGAYYNLSEIMHSIKSYTAHKINTLRNRRGKIWVTESYDRIVRNEKEYFEKLNYLLNNAVKAGLVSNPYEYKWLYIYMGTDKMPV